MSFANKGVQVIDGTTETEPALALRATGLRKSYTGPGGELRVLDGVDLEVRRGELVAIMGVSGSGKSTLLNLLGALDRPDGGTLQIGGLTVETMQERARCRLRSERLGFVFQSHHLLPEFTAEENIMMPMLIAGRTPEVARVRARELLDAVGLSNRAEHRPSELSGGEAQRVAVARALAPRPELVLADEPSGNLDVATAAGLHDMLASLTRHEHHTVVLVTHDDRLASLADRVMVLESGRLAPASH
ncbi:MAG: ABC transporter ATP-binding protein [Candidatus Eisenbacteria bacterium]